MARAKMQNAGAGRISTRKLTALAAVIIASVALCAHARPRFEYPFQNPDLSLDERANNVVSLLTLDEKISALGEAAVPRLNIISPGASEGIHMVVGRVGPGGPPITTTSFAQVYGMGETWDPDLIRKAGAVEGYEARYLTQNDKYKRNILILFGPTSDMARDPRWGRTDESYGEDPYLTGTMVVSFIKGMQGDDPKYWQAASLLKHFFANSNETTRGGSTSDFDEQLMREYYSVPFRMGFTEGGAKSYMTSYNAWNGVPMALNPILKTVVAKEWGAGWIAMPDAGALNHVVDMHHYLKNMQDVYVGALKVGLNSILFPGFGPPTVPSPADAVRQALKDKQIAETDIDSAIVGKFKTDIKLGLLDPPGSNPYARIGAGGEPEPWNTDKDKGVARHVARESVVLLKNTDGLLPLTKAGLKSIAVVGPNAAKVRFDFYSGATPYAISVLQGIQEKLGSSVQVNYAEKNQNGAAVSAAKSSDVAVVVVGNDPMCGVENPFQAFNPDASTKPCPDPGMGREGRDRESLELAQEDLVKQVYAANPKTIVVLVSSFPYAINWSQANVPAILHITHAAQEQGTAIADVLFGDYDPAGRLVQTWPKSLDQLPPIMDYDIRHGRTYMYSKSEPLYPFGYGLSYTTFKYSNLHVSPDHVTDAGTITVSMDVTNTGKRDGDDVVQMYATHLNSKVDRPAKQLEGFKRVNLAAGQTKTVELPLKAEALAYWDVQTHKWVLERDKVKITLGSSSADSRLESTVSVR
jgi:beta-glucosidase